MKSKDDYSARSFRRRAFVLKKPSRAPLYANMNSKILVYLSPTLSTNYCTSMRRNMGRLRSVEFVPASSLMLLGCPSYPKSLSGISPGDISSATFRISHLEIISVSRIVNTVAASISGTRQSTLGFTTNFRMRLFATSPEQTFGSFHEGNFSFGKSVTFQRNFTILLSAEE